LSAECVDIVELVVIEGCESLHCC